MNIDEALILRCQHGEKSAFGELVKPYLQKAYAISLSFLRSKELAEDTVQNALIEAYIGIMEKKDIRSFSGWFLTLVSSRSLDTIRKTGKITTTETSLDQSQLELNGATTEPEEHLLKKERNNLLLQMIMALPDELRIVTILYYYQDLSLKEISQLINVPTSTIKTRLFRARVSLGKVIPFQNEFKKVGDSAW
ncbi:sigma-70 family RNA polymerase sigma factor [Bacillus sp. 31A1R]|uniref:Sigma-70 family RNA polymerase sigma factor n=1 Tax=Robertmurraya mangrovi TaxID=3098077 RepID=A0ABU5ITI1_9BACI|nr:sigma-70 family RNA polymerase sigma factor [Bacillus sp. 31A1R]MDZ5470468.1 sigma-70 family RNA polymerase sigma factor [Bacillus sp. 31A1R]